SFEKAKFEISTAEQRTAHGFSAESFLNDRSAFFAITGGFFDMDAQKRLSPAGVLVVDGTIRNGKPNRQSGALVVKNGNAQIIWSRELGDLSGYSSVIQAGPILVEAPGQLGIKSNDFDRL